MTVKARRWPFPLPRSGGGYGRGPAAAFLLALVATALLACAAAAAELNFPPLSGRVVDQANILSPDTRAALTAKLKDLEDKSGIQLVVAKLRGRCCAPAPIDGPFGLFGPRHLRARARLQRRRRVREAPLRIAGQT